MLQNTQQNEVTNFASSATSVNQTQTITTSSIIQAVDNNLYTNSSQSVENGSIIQPNQFNLQQITNLDPTSAGALIHNPIPLQFVPTVSYGAANLIQGKI